jgi:heme O synthase-like polyprenyltransferase
MSDPMTGDAKAEPRQTAAPERSRRPPPAGYRQGIITAITVLLGFSLAFLRFWGLEASGQWTARSVLSTLTLVVAVVLQIVALFRSLRIEDDDEHEYRKTVRWFIASAAVMLLALLLAMTESAAPAMSTTR